MDGSIAHFTEDRRRHKPADDDLVHRALARFQRTRLTPQTPRAPRVRHEEQLLEAAEEELLGRACQSVAQVAARAPRTAEAFIAWFMALEHTGPGQGDPLFPWLAEQASLPALRWFLAQEVAGEAGFDDLVALTQVKMPPRAKLEMAANYWDEMGRGNARAMHAPLLEQLAATLELHVDAPDTVPEALALSNLMIGMACNRRYAFHSVGALGAIELTAPGRAACVNRALERLHVPAAARRYYAVHAVLDVKHAQTWLSNVIGPLVAEDGERAPFIAEGALIRLAAGARCFARYRKELGMNA